MSECDELMVLLLKVRNELRGAKDDDSEERSDEDGETLRVNRIKYFAEGRPVSS